MSGFVGVFGSPAADASVATMMLKAGEKRGDVTHSAVRLDRGSFLAVQRFEWELSPDFAGPMLLLEEGEFVVAADATLYYRDDLVRKLAGRDITPSGRTNSHLILAAYRAWGAECTTHLEGDFAFVIWNRVSGEVFFARDFTGRRPLYFAEWGGTLAVASTIGAIHAHPACPREYNVEAIGAMACGLDWSAGIDTCYRAIRVVPPASQVLAGREPARISTYWSAFVRREDPSQSLADAAEEMRSLLERATLERMAGEGTTSIWLSGGWDSTAIFGAGRAALRASGSPRQLLPVSISYPVGDPGREDELINDVANFWQSPIHWLDIHQIPLFDDSEARATTAVHPPAHIYEPWNRALAQGTRKLDSRIALDGNGGDQLFQVSDIYLSDLLKQGRLVELAREFRIKRSRGLRRFLRLTVEPLLPRPLARVLAPVTRSGNRHYLQRPLPSWARNDFVAQHRLEERDLAFLPTGPAWSRADAEVRALLTSPGACNILGYMAGELLQEGVETRSPLIDRRVVEFALRRPTSDRATRRETKRLLRQAVRGTLPDHVLAPRPYRTGTTLGYWNREMRAQFPALLERMMQQPLELARLGVIDEVALRDAVTRFGAGEEVGSVRLFHTLNMEWWLRGRRAMPNDQGSDRPLAALSGVVS